MRLFLVNKYHGYIYGDQTLSKCSFYMKKKDIVLTKCRRDDVSKEAMKYSYNMSEQGRTIPQVKRNPPYECLETS